MKPTQEQISTELKALRKQIETSKDPVLARISQAAEHSILWVIGYYDNPSDTPSEFSKSLTMLCHADIKLISK